MQLISLMNSLARITRYEDARSTHPAARVLGRHDAAIGVQSRGAAAHDEDTDRNRAARNRQAPDRFIPRLH
jgi:hypothetical protein